MAEGRVRSRAKDLFAELDVEIEKLNKSGELQFTKGASKPAKRPAAKPSASSAPPAKGKPTPWPEPEAGGKPRNALNPEFDSSVTKTTKGPATVRGRKGTETTKVTAGTMKRGKSDNPQMQRASDDMRVKSKYMSLARNPSSREAIRAKLVEAGSPDLEAFNRAYPQKKSKKK